MTRQLVVKGKSLEMVDSAVAVVGRNGTERAEIDLRELLGGYKNGLSLPPLWLSTSTMGLFQKKAKAATAALGIRCSIQP